MDSVDRQCAVPSVTVGGSIEVIEGTPRLPSQVDAVLTTRRSAASRLAAPAPSHAFGGWRTASGSATMAAAPLPSRHCPG